jgi:SAM-dependent methyltransferase
MAEWWEYDQLESRHPADWSPAERGDREFDQLDFHLDLGCGTVPKARLGIDRHPHPNVGLNMELESLTWVPPPHGASEEVREIGQRSYELCKGKSGSLPFPDGSIRSIISHHCLEHIGGGFLHLMDECHRVMESGAIFRIIVPLFPSYSAVADPDHKRYFCEGTFKTFEGAPDGAHWHESFSVPYTRCRFELMDEDISPYALPERMFLEGDAREMRVALRKR